MRYFNAILIVFYQYFTVLPTIKKEIITIIIIVIINMELPVLREFTIMDGGQLKL